MPHGINKRRKKCVFSFVYRYFSQTSRNIPKRRTNTSGRDYFETFFTASAVHTDDLQNGWDMIQ
jgi:hypothetical protein